MKAHPNPTHNASLLSLLLIGLLSMLLFLPSCGLSEQEQRSTLDQVHQSYLSNVRLGDGVPLGIGVSVRWHIDDLEEFKKQFATPEHYDSLVLEPRELELANQVTLTYDDVDTVFSDLRHQLIRDLKVNLTEKLGESGVTIKEVIISKIIFPTSYTKAKETLAMQEQELDRIRKQSTLDLESSLASRKQAESDGLVAMAQAEMDAKVQRINAETEKSRRASELAKAETSKQVSKLQAESDAEREVLLAKADLKKQTDLKNLGIQKQRDLDDLSIRKTERLEDVQLKKDLKMAQLCSDNPNYASYMVNKELASKVQIAVLPTGQDANVFNGLLNNGLK